MGTTPGSAERRFPGFDVTAQSPTWDETTKAVVIGRLATIPPIRFFTSQEEPTARALVDRLLAQDDDPKIPVLEMIDQRLVEQLGDGYRYEDLPEDPDAWRRSVHGFDSDARGSSGKPFWKLERGAQQDAIEEVRLTKGVWHGMPAPRLFSLWMRYVCSAFYSHPWAWNEIGFGGPAYPRGYKNLGLDRREPWEVPERHEGDPLPWAERAEAARRRHTADMTSDDLRTK